MPFERPNACRPSYRLISPPAAFRSSEPALNKLALAAESGPPAATPTQQRSSGDTELTSRLTRTRAAPVAAAAAAAKGAPAVNGRPGGNDEREQRPKRTLTKLEQSLVVGGGGSGSGSALQLDERQPTTTTKMGEPSASASATASGPSAAGCRFKAQMVFESDTDSMAERNSLTSAKSASSQQKRKELVSETRYSCQGTTPSLALEEAAAAAGGRGARRRTKLGASGQPAPVQPNWDYSLRVSRMRGNKVDSSAK